MKLLTLTIFLIVLSCNALAGHRTIDSLIHLKNSTQSDSIRNSALANLASEYYYFNTDSSSYFLEEMKENAIKSRRIDWEQEYVTLKTYNYLKEGKIELADKLVTRYLEQTQYAKNESYQFLFVAKGNIEAKKGNTIEALYNYSKAYEYYHNLANSELSKDQKERFHSVLNGLSRLHNKRDDFETSLMYDLEGFALIDSNAYSVSNNVAYNNLGTNYIYTGQYDKAEQMIKHSIEIVDSLKTYWISGIGESKLAEIYFRKKEYVKAKLFVDSSLALLYKHKVTAYPSDHIELLKGKIENKLGNYAAAINACKTPYKIGLKNKDNYRIKDACDCLKEAYTFTNNIKNALKYSELGNQIRDSILHKINFAKKEIEFTYQSIYQKKIIDSLALKEQSFILHEKESEINSFNKTLVILALITISLATISLLIYINFRKTKSYNKKIENSLYEKEWMLKEIHHRVKNNFQVINSLIRIQLFNNNNPEVEKEMNEIQERISAMSIVHDKLYATSNFASISMQEYYEELTNNVVRSFVSNQNLVEKKVTANAIQMDLERAVPLGLLSSEVITNAMKYGKSEDGITYLDITLKEKNEEIFLNISDKGKGISIQPSDNSVGMELIKVLTEQLDGKIKFINKQGLNVELTFPAKTTSSTLRNS